VADSTVAPASTESTVAEARTLEDDHRIPYLYIVDQEHRLVGVIHRRDLDGADAEASLRSVMIDRLQTIPASAPLALVHEHVAWSDHDVLPVVDPRGAFIGVIRHRTLRATLLRPGLDSGPNTALTALLDLGEAYWSSLFSAILTLSSSRSGAVEGGGR
jgi:predicted transcriptional regulator